MPVDVRRTRFSAIVPKYRDRCWTGSIFMWMCRPCPRKISWYRPRRNHRPRSGSASSRRAGFRSNASGERRFSAMLRWPAATSGPTAASTIRSVMSWSRRSIAWGCRRGRIIESLKFPVRSPTCQVMRICGFTMSPKRYNIAAWTVPNGRTDRPCCGR